jgi:hypothetical protein
MKEYTYPTRKALILGAVRVALYGYSQERIMSCRHHGSDWANDPEYKECLSLMLDLRQGKEIHTQNLAILGLMALTRQILGVSLEEWDTYFPEKPWAKE